MRNATNPMLKRLSALVSLTDGEIELLEGLTFEMRKVTAGEWLWHEGDSADSLLVISEGWGCSARYLSDGSRQLFATYLPGDILGIFELLSGIRRNDVSMLTDGRVCEYSYSSIFTLLNASNSVRSALFVIANQHQAMLAERLVSVARRNARESLAHFLCECRARLLEFLPDDVDGFQLPLSQQDLADALGMSTVHISRTFSALACQGLVRRQHFHIVILDPQRLAEMADFDDHYLNCDKRILTINKPISLPEPVATEWLASLKQDSKSRPSAEGDEPTASS
ncbi:MULTISPECIES: Crp/Fnr family transcriptional regulator [Halomonadaceae]|uniref:Crp/Fnr family transcriptional regulator n=1 Tax=Modicisalibacter zincidurans TaxID=1178777 RepID=A0ABP9R4I8_9GAMM|nr:Crp/Fnr family transcriptional regulator [Halomonas zincidurans]MCD6009737.1 Crp/Fnr family transcriptional regulator [Halomonas sp. IOP_31]